MGRRPSAPRIMVANRVAMSQRSSSVVRAHLTEFHETDQRSRRWLMNMRHGLRGFAFAVSLLLAGGALPASAFAQGNLPVYLIIENAVTDENTALSTFPEPRRRSSR